MSYYIINLYIQSYLWYYLLFEFDFYCKIDKQTYKEKSKCLFILSLTEF
jgi:hypothetical protein